MSKVNSCTQTTTLFVLFLMILEAEMMCIAIYLKWEFGNYNLKENLTCYGLYIF